MILSLMRFCGYEWEHNPLRVEISHLRGKKTHLLPFFGTQVTDMGRYTRVISGEGELVGKGCLEQFRELEELYKSDRKGLLTLPGIYPMKASFTRLKAIGETTPDLVVYSFEFTEVDNLGDDFKGEVYVCKEGDTLFDIAYITGVSVQRLVSLNKNIRRPDEPSEGMEVRLC